MTDDLLIVGEPGAGKCTAAEKLARAERTIVVLDCRAPPAVLVESVLFGHIKNSCFGPNAGTHVRNGVLDEAGEGTVVLDEIAAIPRELQPRLARTLAERKLRRVGANTPHAWTARVIATTSRPGDLVPVLRERFTAQPLAPLRDRLDELAPELAAGERARLSRLRLDVENVRRVAESADRGAAIAELELLAAIAGSDDEAPRRVYADLLLERGDPRGELIHLQCERPDAPRTRQLLALYGDVWLAPVLAVPHVTAATLRRGFVEIVHGSADLERAMDELERAAPVLRELHEA